MKNKRTKTITSNLKTDADYDVIVIGGGAAGISAALWCDELSLKTLLLEEKRELGGQLLRTYNPIKNHLGTNAENGRELRDIFVRQIEYRHFSIKLSSSVAEIDLKNKIILLDDGERFCAGAIIIATGVRRRKLNVKGETEFQKKGIIESGKRDQNKISGKNAAVIGGGDAAFENALILAETAEKVSLIHRSKDFRARSEFIERVKNHPKIEVLSEFVAKEIIGDDSVKAIKLQNLRTNQSNILSVETILIRIGVEPNSKFCRGQIKLDQKDYIKINQNCETNIRGVFAVGDVANPLAPTVSSAVGMGATAVKVIYAGLNS